MKKQFKLPALSVFFPAYNEEDNLRGLVEEVITVLPQVAKDYEVIIVDDGSTDQTYQVAQQLTQQYSHLRVVTQENRGYGGALQKGFAEAKYDWIFYSDADQQFDLAEIKKLILHTQNNQLIIGYRQERAEGLKRKLIAKALKLWNHFWLGFPFEFKDVDCAFKLLHRSLLNQIQPLQSEGAMISTEILMKAHLIKAAYAQIPVKHYLRQHGQPSGNNLKVIWQAVLETFHLRKVLLQQKAASLATT